MLELCNGHGGIMIASIIFSELMRIATLLSNIILQIRVHLKISLWATPEISEVV